DHVGLALGGTSKAQRAHQPVDLQRLGTRELRQPARRCPAEELELPEAVLAVAEAESKGQIEIAPRADVGNAVAVTQDVDRCLEPAQRHTAGGLRKGP